MLFTVLVVSYGNEAESKQEGIQSQIKPLSEKLSLIAPGAEIIKLADGFRFTEGPAADAEGNVFFTDIPNNRIHKWSLDGSPLRGKLSTFRENSRGANGLFFDKAGNLVACEGGGRQLVSIDPNRQVTVLADKYQGKKFNSLNDLWIDPNGGIYFTDPRYGRNRDDMEQDGEHVYYLTPDRKSVIRVIDDMVRPNGLIGTPDGKLLYVADHGGNKTFVYTTNADGTLSNKKLFASEGSDGMTIDNQGNIYLTTDAVVVYNKNGERIDTIEVPERPSNVCFGGKDNQTLFITSRTGLYAIKMRTKGAQQPGKHVADACRVTGRLVDSGGKPVSGTKVYVTHASGGADVSAGILWWEKDDRRDIVLPHAVTDEQGFFEIFVIWAFVDQPWRPLGGRISESYKKGAGLTIVIENPRRRLLIPSTGNYIFAIQQAQDLCELGSLNTDKFVVPETLARRRD
jgi:gluconolactonase